KSSGRSSTRSSPAGSATGRRSRTIRPARGGRRARTTSCTGTDARGDGTELAEGGRPARRRRGGARRAAGRSGGRRAEHADVGDDAHRLGAARLEGEGARGA